MSSSRWYFARRVVFAGHAYQAVRANGSGQPPFWGDLLVTGLVVGAGTKPLHDLVSNIEHGKNAKLDPPSAKDRRQ